MAGIWYQLHNSLSEIGFAIASIINGFLVLPDFMSTANEGLHRVLF